MDRFTFLERTIENFENILNYCYENVYFAMLNEWNVTKTSFDHAQAGMEESCLWAQQLCLCRVKFSRLGLEIGEPASTQFKQLNNLH